MKEQIYVTEDHERSLNITRFEGDPPEGEAVIAGPFQTLRAALWLVRHPDMRGFTVKQIEEFATRVAKSKGAGERVKGVYAVAGHRNGISGAPFDVVLFDGYAEDEQGMVAIVFEEQCHVAVLNTRELTRGNIAFGEGNSWRGDQYEKELRQAIEQWRENETE